MDYPHHELSWVYAWEASGEGSSNPQSIQRSGQDDTEQKGQGPTESIVELLSSSNPQSIQRSGQDDTEQKGQGPTESIVELLSMVQVIKKIRS
nr:phosphoenolpyruvate carboxylase family protein [Tanacetum cinerariifolium]